MTLCASCVKRALNCAVWSSLIATLIMLITHDISIIDKAQAQARLSPEASSRSPQGPEPARSPEETTTQNFHQRIAPALRWTHEGVWQPPQSEISLGLSEVRWAPLRWLNLNTWTLPWIVGGANIGAQVSIASGARWAVSAEWRGLTINFERFMSRSSDSPPETQEAQVTAPRLLVSPVSLSAGYLISPRLTTGLGLHYTAISALGGVEQNAEVEGVAVSTNSHLRFHLGWALTQKWSAWWVVNYLLHQDVGGTAYTVIPFEGGGSLKVYGAVNQSVVPQGAVGHRIYLGYRSEIFSISGGVSLKLGISLDRRHELLSLSC